MVVGSIDEPLPESCFREVVPLPHNVPRVEVSAQWPCERARKAGTNRGEKKYFLVKASLLCSSSTFSAELKATTPRGGGLPVSTRPAGRSRIFSARASMMAVRHGFGRRPEHPPLPLLLLASVASLVRPRAILRACPGPARPQPGDCGRRSWPIPGGGWPPSSTGSGLHGLSLSVARARRFSIILPSASPPPSYLIPPLAAP